LARDQLANGVDVVAECVNPLKLTRDAWRAIGPRVLEIELVCSEPGEHRARVEGRVADIAGLRLPTWQDVVEREYVGSSAVVASPDTGLKPFDPAVRSQAA